MLACHGSQCPWSGRQHRPGSKRYMSTETRSPAGGGRATAPLFVRAGRLAAHVGPYYRTVAPSLPQTAGS